MNVQNDGRAQFVNDAVVAGLGCPSRFASILHDGLVMTAGARSVRHELARGEENAQTQAERP